MKMLLTVISCFAILGVCTAWGQDRPASTVRIEKQSVYACPHHPEMRATWPAHCPKCGQTLRRRGEPTSRERRPMGPESRYGPTTVRPRAAGTLLRLGDPEMLLRARRGLHLSDRQVQELRQIDRTARRRALSVLTDAQIARLRSYARARAWRGGPAGTELGRGYFDNRYGRAPAGRFPGWGSDQFGYGYAPRPYGYGYAPGFRERFGDEGFGEGFGDEGFGDEGFGDEGFGDEGFGDEGFGGEGFGEGFGDEGFGGEGFGGEGFGGEGFGGEGFGGEGFGGEGFGGEGFGGEGFGGEGFGGEGFGGEGFGGEGFGGEGFGGEGFGGEGFGGEGFGGEGFGGEGFGGEGFGGEGFGGEGRGGEESGAR